MKLFREKEKPEIMGARLCLFDRRPLWLYLRLFKGWKLRRINYIFGLPDIWLEKPINSTLEKNR